MSLPNYSFTINKLTLEYLADILGISVDILRSKSKELDINGYRVWIGTEVRKMLGSKFPKSYKEQEALLDRFEDYYGYFHSFNNGKHFCAKSIPEEYLTKTLNEGVLQFPEEIFVDFEYEGFNGCINFYRRKGGELHVKNTPVVYSATLFYDREDCYAVSPKGDVVQASWCYLFHISGSGKLLAIEVARSVKRLRKVLALNKVEFNDDILSGEFDGVVNLQLKYNKLPERSFIFGLLNYVIDCYKYRKTIERKNVKMNRHYKIHEVRESSSDEANYVPLTVYAKQAERKPYQGGHHKSPCEHERRGGFRIVPSGKGKYSIINGEYVRVPDGTGTHTIVRGTHVGGDKKNKVTVYKV